MNDPGQHGPAHWKLYLLLALMVALWSGNYIVGKIALRQLPALVLVCFRITFAGLLMLPLYASEQRRMPRRNWSRKDVPALILLGICGVNLNQVFFVIGLSRTSVAHTSLVIALTPLLVLSLAAIRGLEHFTTRKVIGMAIAVSGVMTLNFSRASGASPSGDFIVLLGALSFTFFTVLGKESSRKYGNITLNTFAYTGSALIAAPLTIYFLFTFPLAQVTWGGWVSVFYMSAFSSVLCYLIYYHALRYIAASRVSALSYLQPLLATLMAVPVLGEVITPPLMLGGALILAGVYVTERT